MTSLLLHKKFQIRLIVRSKLFVHKKAECSSSTQLHPDGMTAGFTLKPFSIIATPDHHQWDVQYA